MFDKYVRQHEAVEALQLNHDNFEFIFEFLTGHAAHDRGLSRIRQQIGFQTRDGESRTVYFGEWIVKTGNGSFIFSDEDFTSAFIMAPDVQVNNEKTDRQPVYVDSPPKYKLDS